MIDAWVTPWSKRCLEPLATQLVKRGVSADQITVAGFLLGMLAVPAIALEYYTLGLLLIVLNRLADGLDGAVARQTTTTDAGGYLDIVLDFIFYSAIPLGFLLANPEQNAIAAAVLMLTFMGTGSTFLAFASVAAKRGIEDVKFSNKSLHYMGGLTEGLETIIAFLAFCWFPQYFPLLASLFAVACWITVITRLWSGYRTLQE